MAWNGSGAATPSENNENGGTAGGVGKRRPGAVRGLVAGLIIVAGAGIAAWLVIGRSEAPRTPEGPSGHGKRTISDVSKPVVPAASVTNAAVQAAPRTPPKKEPKTYVDKRGILRYEGGLRVVKKIVKPPEDQMNSNGPHLFENNAEHEILGLMTTEPGTFMIDVKYDKRTFEKAFVESLKHTIEVLPDDTPEVREQKLAVIEAKAALEAAYKRGEDVTEIMNESRGELVRLNRYRDSLIEMASENLSKDGTTDKDLDEYVDAMNKMLKDNGIREIKHKELARSVLRYRRNAEAARKAAEESRQQQPKQGSDR